MICILRNSRPPRGSQLLQREAVPALLGRLDQVEVIVGRNAAAHTPRMCSSVRDREVLSDFLYGWPDVSDVLHKQKLRNMRSVSQYANGQVNFAPCVDIITGGNP